MTSLSRTWQDWKPGRARDSAQGRMFHLILLLAFKQAQDRPGLEHSGRAHSPDLAAANGEAQTLSYFGKLPLRNSLFDHAATFLAPCCFVACCNPAEFSPCSRVGWDTGE